MSVLVEKREKIVVRKRRHQQKSKRLPEERKENPGRFIHYSLPVYSSLVFLFPLCCCTKRPQRLTAYCMFLNPMIYTVCPREALVLKWFVPWISKISFLLGCEKFYRDVHLRLWRLFPNFIYLISLSFSNDNDFAGILCDMKSLFTIDFVRQTCSTLLGFLRSHACYACLCLHTSLSATNFSCTESSFLLQ
jgi:hypothetical protein